MIFSGYQMLPRKLPLSAILCLQESIVSIKETLMSKRGVKLYDLITCGKLKLKGKLLFNAIRTGKTDLIKC